MIEENMTARQYLKQIKILDDNINNKIAEKYRLECLATHITPVLSDMKVQTSHNADKTADICVKIVECEQEINDMIDQYVDTRNVIITQIEGIEDQRYYNLLHNVYVQYKNLIDTANIMGYDYETLRHLHLDALDQFYEQYLKVNTQ